MELKPKPVLFFIVAACMIISSCAPSKEDSLRRFERLVSNVQGNYISYNDRDWLKIDRQIVIMHNNLTKRFRNSLTQEDVNRIAVVLNTYNYYRSGERIALGSSLKELMSQLDMLQSQIIDDQMQEVFPLTEQTLLIQRLQNELLMQILVEKRQGRLNTYGRIKMLVLPATYSGNTFRMNRDTLTPVINEAVNIILAQARRYNQNISIDWEYGFNSDGSYVSINNYRDGLRQFSRYRNNYGSYDRLVLVYAVDMQGRSHCGILEPLGSYEDNAIVWFRNRSSNRHTAGVLAHEIFHAFGAEDFYFENNVVPREVEVNFRTLLGESIMITEQETSNLDPINAWLIGWNRNPELWYAWFINRRDYTVDVGL